MDQVANPFDTEELRRVGHRLIDWMADYLAAIEEAPLFPKAGPQTIARLFDAPLPRAASKPETLLEELERKLYPHCCHVNHPGYFGLITSTPTPMGILGDLITSALNQNIGLYAIGPSAVALERQVIRWLSDLVGYGDQAGGHLTSGGTMANFEGLKLARDWRSGNRAQHDGIRKRWTVYASEERHVSVDKAVDAVGIGRDLLRPIATGDDFRISLEALEARLAADKAEGFEPLCLVGIAGTTNTGAVDPLADLRRIADREGMWLHVDAAYGGGMLLSRRWPGLLKQVRMADSVTIDPHKWFYAPLDAGAFLVREGSQLARSFGLKPPYLAGGSDAGGERFDYYVHSFEQSRRFRGLKVWLGFCRYGTDQIGSWIDANVEQAQHLYRLSLADQKFEAAAAPGMSAICLRYRGEGLTPEQSAALHSRVAARLEAGGRFWISTTRLKGKTYFRINPVNFRTRQEHMTALFEALQAESDAEYGRLRRHA